MIRKLISVVTFVLMGVCAAHAVTLNPLHAFCLDKHCHDGNNPMSGLLRDPSTGTLYGVTFQGGSKHKGTIYALMPASGTRDFSFQKLYDFCPRDNCKAGASPDARLIADSAGNLYGTAVFGGNSSSEGTVFELIPNTDKTSWKIKVLHTFCPEGVPNCPDGANPITALTYQGQASGLPYDGSSPLYGTTESGGTSINAGTVYKLVPDGHGGWQESVLYNFCSVGECTDGAHPFGDLTMDSNGNLFGTANEGGARLAGTIYEISGAARGGAVSMTTLYNFCQGSHCQDGEQPSSGVTLDGEGNLYGTTTFGGLGSNNGIVYKFIPSGQSPQLQVLHSFCSEKPNCQDGSEPAGNLAIDASGNLYGTATKGSRRTFPLGGTAFELTPGSNETYTFSTLYKFCHEKACADGSGPASGVVMDNVGNLYGTTENGGKRRNNTGTVFELTP